jgi:hypothetical protein
MTRGEMLTHAEDNLLAAERMLALNSSISAAEKAEVRAKVANGWTLLAKELRIN